MNTGKARKDIPMENYEKLIDAIFDFGTYSLDELIYLKKIFDRGNNTRIIIGRPTEKDKDRVLDIFYDKELCDYITIIKA